MTPLFTAQKEVARRYAANQEMAVVLNKMLQAHERELRARMLVEMPRTQPVLPAIAKQNQQRARALRGSATGGSLGGLRHDS
jgi:hypothetical protein